MTQPIISIDCFRILGGVELLLENAHKFVSDGNLCGIGSPSCDHGDLALATIGKTEGVGGATWNKWGNGSWDNSSTSLGQGLTEKQFEFLKQNWAGLKNHLFNEINERAVRELIAQGEIKVVSSREELVTEVKEFFGI